VRCVRLVWLTPTTSELPPTARHRLGRLLPAGSRPPATTLLVTPASGSTASGTHSGPFSPSSFRYTLSSTFGLSMATFSNEQREPDARERFSQARAATLCSPLSRRAPQPRRTRKHGRLGQPATPLRACCPCLGASPKGRLYREPLLSALNRSFHRRNSSTRLSRTFSADVATFGERALRSGIAGGGEALRIRAHGHLAH
jgi:hypothetical protein